MALRIEWDKFEVALLIDACEQVLSKKVAKPEIVAELSAALRFRALKNGIEIDDIFRNENGISLQMTKMDYLLTDGKNGLPGASKLYSEIADLRKTNPEEFGRILNQANEQIGKKEAKALVDNKEYFSLWLSSHSTKKFTSEQIIEALDESSNYCKSHGMCKEAFWSISEVDVFSSITSRLAGMRLFRLTHRKLASVLDKAIPLYKDFLKEQETAKDATGAESKPDVIPVSDETTKETPQSPTVELVYFKDDSDDIIRLKLDLITKILLQRYSTSPATSLSEIVKSNKDIPVSYINTWTKKAENQTAAQYLIAKGIIAKIVDNRSEEEKRNDKLDKLREITNILLSRYESNPLSSLTELIKQNPDIPVGSVSIWAKDLLGQTASEYFREKGILLPLIEKTPAEKLEDAITLIKAYLGDRKMHSLSEVKECGIGITIPTLNNWAKSVYGKPISEYLIEKNILERESPEQFNEKSQVSPHSFGRVIESTIDEDESAVKEVEEDKYDDEQDDDTDEDEEEPIDAMELSLFKTLEYLKTRYNVRQHYDHIINSERTILYKVRNRQKDIMWVYYIHTRSSHYISIETEPEYLEDVSDFAGFTRIQKRASHPRQKMFFEDFGAIWQTLALICDSIDRYFAAFIPEQSHPNRMAIYQKLFSLFKTYDDPAGISISWIMSMIGKDIDEQTVLDILNEATWAFKISDGTYSFAKKQEPSHVEPVGTMADESEVIADSTLSESSIQETEKQEQNHYTGAPIESPKNGDQNKSNDSNNANELMLERSSSVKAPIPDANLQEVPVSGASLSFSESYAGADGLTVVAPTSKNRYAIYFLQSVVKQNEAILVKEYLNIHDFEDLSITQLGLSARATNCLLREFGEAGTLRSILEMPIKRLINLKNTGAKTVQEILSRTEELTSAYVELPEPSFEPPVIEIKPTERGLLASLRPFATLIAEENWDEIEAKLETDTEEDALIRVMKLSECIGADMVAAALSDPYPTQVLIPALQGFIREQADLKQRQNSIQYLVEHLPESRKNLPVRPFLLTWSRREVAKTLDQEIDDILTFDQLAELSAQLSIDEYNALRTFLPWCSFDIETEVAKVLDRCIKDERARKVVALRAEGKTLAEVGDSFRITRERIRQIEAKAVKRCKAAGGEAVLLKISSVRGGDEILTASEIKGYCGKDGDLFLHLLRNIPDLRRFRYTKTLDAFILGNEQVEEEHVRAFVDDLPDRIEAGQLSDYLKQASEQGIPSELVKLQIHTDYSFSESGQAWQRGRSTIRKMCREVLPSFDPDGVHVSVSEELKEFRNRLYQRFGKDIRIPEGDRALTAIIYDVGMLRDRGTYVAVRDHILSDDLLQRIRAYVDSGDNEVFMFDTLYEVFRNQLQQAGVDNRYYLQGILKREWEGLYSFSRDCISKGKRATNIYDTVEAFVKKSGGYVSSAEIKEAFPGITDAILNLALSQREIIACGGKFIHANALQIDEGIVRQMHQVVETLVSDGHEHHSRELYDLANCKISDWMDEVGATSHSVLFGIAAYLFDDECVFSRPWFAKKGTIGEEAIRNLRSRGSTADLVEWTVPSPQKDDTGQLATNPVQAEIADRWNTILSEEFKDGLRLNGMRLRKFRGIYEERFHETLEPDDEKLIELLKLACDYRDERIFASKDRTQASLVDTIREEILVTLTNGASCVYPQQLFERYRDQLGVQLSIYNSDALVRTIYDPAKCSFRVIWGLFCLSGKSVNVTSDVFEIFKKTYAPLTYSQLAEQLWYIPFDKIKHILATEPSLVNIDQETYFYAPLFPISSEELAALRRAMQLKIEDEGYIVARDLRELMQTHCPNAVMDTASWKDWGVRDVIGWLLRDSFDFMGIVICAKGAGLGTAQVFRSFCKTRHRLSLEELKDLCAQLEVSGIYWGDVNAEMVRISQTEFVSKRDVIFDVEATDAVLETICKGDYMPLKSFTLYMALPAASFPWNGFLLESYLRDYSRLFRLEQAGPTETTFIGAMVRRSSKIRTMRDLLVDVLAHEESWSNVKDALAYIAQQGYRSSRTMANATEIINAAQALRERLKAAEE